MSASYELDYTRNLQRKIVWDKTRTKAAQLLAVGHNKQYVADEVGVSRATIYNWLDDPEFGAEVDRLSTMVDAASRAERLRDTMRVLRSLRDENGVLRTDKDALDWLKYAQSETDGTKLDMSKLMELLAGESGDGPASNSGQQHQLPPAIEVDAVESGESGESLSAEPVTPSSTNE